MSPEVTARFGHKTRHTFGTVEQDAGDILAFPRPLGVLRGQLALPSRGVRQGWRYAHVDLVPPDGPRAA